MGVRQWRGWEGSGHNLGETKWQHVGTKVATKGGGKKWEPIGPPNSTNEKEKIKKTAGTFFGDDGSVGTAVAPRVPVRINV